MKINLRQYYMMLMLVRLGFIDMIVPDEYDEDGKLRISIEVSKNIIKK